MRTILFASLAAVALFATTARADEVSYPSQEKVFTTGIVVGDIVTPDAIFPGPHAAVLRGDVPHTVLSSTVATSDDFLYQFAEPIEATRELPCDSRHEGMLASADGPSCG